MPAPLTAAERFWPHVNKSGTCWLWTGRLTSQGYGAFFDRRPVAAHRWAYININGEVPPGLQLDHLCRVRYCVNPAHLQVVNLKTNVLRGDGVTARNARKTHCMYGHEFTSVNTAIRVDGSRQCRTCSTIRARHYENKARAARDGRVWDREAMFAEMRATPIMQQYVGGSHA